MAFCILGSIWSPKACLATWGRFTASPHAHRANRPIFRSMGFPWNPSWIICRWSPQYHWGPPEHPRDTSHTFSASCLRLPIRPVYHVSDYIILIINKQPLVRTAPTPETKSVCRIKRCAIRNSIVRHSPSDVCQHTHASIRRCGGHRCADGRGH